MKTTSYNFDAINTVLTITKDFARKASQLNSPEYKTMLQLRRDYPNLEIVMREGTKKQAASGITFKQMEGFIEQCRDAANRLATYKRVKALSKVQRSPYKYVKEWFLNNYANYSENPEFDEEGFVIVKTKAQMEQEAKAAAAGEGAARGGTITENAADNKVDEAAENGCIVTTFVEESEKTDVRGDTNSAAAA